MRWTVAMRWLLAAGLALAPCAGLAQAALDAELTKGERQVRSGDLEGAVATLEALVQRIGGDPALAPARVRAYTYLGLAYFGLSQEASARARFLEAVARTSSSDPEELRREVMRAFEAGPGAPAPKPRKPSKGAAGRSRLPLILAVAVAGAGAGGYALARRDHEPPNQAPSAAFTVSPEGGALVGVTSVTFTAAASDPDGDPLAFEWQFGDGGSAAGQVATHVYLAEGSFQVTLAVSDSRNASAAAAASVTVRSLVGRWRLSQGGERFYEWGYDLTQAGGLLGGQPFSVPDQRCLGGITGTLTTPRNLRFQFEDCEGNPIVVEGVVQPGLDTIAATYYPTDAAPEAVVLTRQ